MIPAEHLYVSCTCSGGMRNGERCPDCLGRGLVRRPSEVIARLEEEAAAAGAGEDAGDGLDELPIAQLRKKASEAGLDVTGKKVDLVARIRAAAAVAAPGA
jgi:hypothetical protein